MPRQLTFPRVSNSRKLGRNGNVFYDPHSEAENHFSTIFYWSHRQTLIWWESTTQTWTPGDTDRWDHLGGWFPLGASKAKDRKLVCYQGISKASGRSDMWLET